MAVKYTDKAIADMIAEPKPLPVNWRSRLNLLDKRGHMERELDVIGDHGNEYRVLLRQSEINPLDFSVILALSPPETNQLFCLRRYSGKSHEHTNRIEGATFFGAHVHYATARYQELGCGEDAYAEPCDRYADFESALLCLLRECEFQEPEVDPSPRLGEVTP